ncbi:rod shape-determining protein [Patescibacteria group bacterium]|nr:rod shape-determining protein [Patescibacteria group bacterium]
MLNRFFGQFSKDVAIDLGTSNTRVFVKERGIVMHEPSVVAINNRTNHILAVGRTAKDMAGRTPPHINIIRPLTKGVISDFEVTEKMMKYFVDKVHEETFNVVPRPRIVMTVPMEITEVERKAVEDAALASGAREVFLVESPLASAIGAGLPVEESVGSLIVDIGGGTTQIAVVSLGGIVTWKSLTVASDEMTKSISQYARDVFNLLVGERVAEEVKWRIGSTTDLGTGYEMEMRGRHLLTGLPRQIIIHEGQIREAMYRQVQQITENIKATLEVTPPELVADIYERGLVLVGGGSLLRGIDRTIQRETDIPVRVAEDPTTAGVRGAGKLLDQEALLKDVALPATGADAARR